MLISTSGKFKFVGIVEHKIGKYITVKLAMEGEVYGEYRKV